MIFKALDLNMLCKILSIYCMMDRPLNHISAINLSDTTIPDKEVCGHMMLDNHNGKNEIHFLVFSWLEQGHINPFLELSKTLTIDNH